MVRAENSARYAIVAPAGVARLALYGALAFLVAATAVEPTILFGTVPAALAVVAAIALSSLRAPVASAAAR